jgi:hypothetical protein
VGDLGKQLIGRGHSLKRLRKRRYGGWRISRSTLVTRWRCTLCGGDGFREASRVLQKRGECEQPSVREFRARVIEEHPNHEGWKPRISEAGTHAGMTTHRPRLSACLPLTSLLTPEYKSRFSSCLRPCPCCSELELELSVR